MATLINVVRNLEDTPDFSGDSRTKMSTFASLKSHVFPTEICFSPETAVARFVTPECTWHWLFRIKIYRYQ